MEILKTLGVDGLHLLIQLVCFLVSYLALSNLVLKPYSAALRERENRTVGNEELAVRLDHEANELYSEYEQKARAVNFEVKKAYDEARAAAMKEYERVVQTARQEAQETLASARQKIANEIQSARKVLSAEVPAVGSAIASKLAGKDISL